jgi:hypothetical protein
MRGFRALVSAMIQAKESELPPTIGIANVVWVDRAQRGSTSGPDASEAGVRTIRRLDHIDAVAAELGLARRPQFAVDRAGLGTDTQTRLHYPATATPVHVAGREPALGGRTIGVAQQLGDDVARLLSARCGDPGEPARVRAFHA